MLFNRSKQIVIDAFTYRPEVFYKAAPVKANKALPDWWKRLPVERTGIDLSTFERTGNMRKCVGFTNLYQHGFVLPMWSDLAIDVNSVGQAGLGFEFADGKTAATAHPEYQRGEYLPESEYAHLKLGSPWAFHTKRDVSWLMTNTAWNSLTPSNFIVPNGVVNFSVISDSNVNLFIPKQSERRQFIIPFGQPIAQYVPIADGKVKLKTHLVDLDEYNRIVLGKSSVVSFSNSLGKSGGSKCPFKL